VREPLPETTYTLTDEVWQQYYAYDRALRQLIKAQQTAWLDGNYIRFPAKAVRIAALLSSLHGGRSQVISPTAWARA
jgi:hypothetical protein